MFRHHHNVFLTEIKTYVSSCSAYRFPGGQGHWTLMKKTVTLFWAIWVSWYLWYLHPSISKAMGPLTIQYWYQFKTLKTQEVCIQIKMHDMSTIHNYFHKEQNASVTVDLANQYYYLYWNTRNAALRKDSMTQGIYHWVDGKGAPRYWTGCYTSV